MKKSKGGKVGAVNIEFSLAGLVEDHKAMSFSGPTTFKSKSHNIERDSE